MAPKAKAFCEDYQLPRLAGVPGCKRPRSECPDLHRCSHCNKSGHGSGDCRELASSGSAAAASAAPAAEAVGVAAASAALAEAVGVAAASAASAAQVAETEAAHGQGFKGFGKGNWGTPIPPPQVVPNAAVDGYEVLNAEGPPPARAATMSEIDSWIQNHFEKLKETTVRSNRLYEVGDVVLWRGFKGNNPSSTKVEYFRGKIHQIKQDASGEVFYQVVKVAV